MSSDARAGAASVKDLAEQLHGLLAQLAGLDVADLSDDEVQVLVPRLLAAVNRLSAVTATAVGSFEARQLCEHDGFRSTRSWLMAFGRMSQGAASGWLKRARLQRELPELAAAAAAGTVSGEQLRTVGRLAEAVGFAEIIRFDGVLAELAAAAGPAEVAHACRRIHAHLDPDGPDPDPHGGFERRELTLSRCGSMVYLRGRLDLEGGAVLATALDAMMRPPGPDDARTAGQRRADAAVELCRQTLARGEVPTVAGVRPQVGVLITPSMLLADTSTSGEDNRPGQAADAAADAPTSSSPSRVPACQVPRHQELQDQELQDRGSRERRPPDHAPPNHAPPDQVPRDRAPRDLARDQAVREQASPPAAEHRDDPLALLGVPPLPELPWAHWVGEVPPELAQRIACDAEVWRAILDPATGLPLEVGRNHRLVPTWMRKALQARDRGCRWPGCTAPAAWTDAHHLLPWWHGGRTDIDNLLLLCRYHHSKVHEGHWRIHLDPTTGELHVYRPDGQPYELAPSKPWTSPGRRTGDT